MTEETERIEAEEILEKLFKTIPTLSKEVKIIPVKFDSCTIFIPVNNYKESEKDGFIAAVQKIYKLTKYWP
jgi:hypothetical protein